LLTVKKQINALSLARERVGVRVTLQVTSHAEGRSGAST